MLDNCEHVVEAVADLVAFLVGAAPRLRVVTTTRAPLAIAAERVYPARPARRRRRGRAVRRAGPRGAARGGGSTRGRSCEHRAAGSTACRWPSSWRRRRSARCRSRTSTGGSTTGSRCCAAATAAAPDRHQTLLAVIDWSWNLLARHRAARAAPALALPRRVLARGRGRRARPRRARRRSRALVDQSLLTVARPAPQAASATGCSRRCASSAGMQLVEAGEDAAARDAQLAWAVRLRPAPRRRPVVAAPGRGDATRSRAEENNLADDLREALALPDRGAVVRLLAALGAFWTIRGENPRVIAVAGACDAALAGWVPDRRAGRRGRVGRRERRAQHRRRRDRWGPRQPGPARRLRRPHRVGPGARAWSRCVKAQVLGDPAGTVGPARGDRAGARPGGRGGRPALGGAPPREQRRPDRRDRPGRPGPGPGQRRRRPVDRGDAAHHGRRPARPARRLRGGRAHARAALPVLDRLGAADDAVQMRSLLVVHAWRRAGSTRPRSGWPRSSAPGAARATSAEPSWQVGRAELALARGTGRGGAARSTGRPSTSSRRSGSRAWATPPGWSRGRVRREPRRVTALAVHGTDAAETYADGRALYLALLAKSAARARPEPPLHGLPRRRAGAVRAGRLGPAARRGAGRRRGAAARARRAVRLQPVSIPTMAARAHRRRPPGAAPGLAARLRADYAGRTAPSLLPEARAAIGRLPGAAAAEDRMRPRHRAAGRYILRA